MKNNLWLVILSGIGNGFQYVFAGVIGIVALTATYDLVASDKLNSETFALVVGTLLGGAFGALNPRGRREEVDKPLWTGQERRKDEDTTPK